MRSLILIGFEFLTLTARADLRSCPEALVSRDSGAEALFQRHQISASSHAAFMEWYEEQEPKVRESVAAIVRDLELGIRLQNLPRVVATSERGIWEIKPQGRTQCRVFLGVGGGQGFRILFGADHLKNRASDQTRAIRAASELWQDFLELRR